MGLRPLQCQSCRRVHLPWPASDAGPYSRIDFRPEDISDRRGGANLCTSLTRRHWPTATARAYNEEVGVRLRRGKRYWLLGVAVLAPLLACLSMVPFRESFANTSAALVLVLVVVAVATAGDRLAGVLAACSAGLWFDFFLTQPYQRFAVTSGADVQTLLLLLTVGVAVTEITHWGRRQHARATQRAGYLEGIEQIAAASAAGTSSPSTLIDTVCEQMAAVLGLTRCRFDYGTGLDYPRLVTDGRLRRGRQEWDGETTGLPTDMDTELIVESGGRFMGRFLLTAGPDTHPARLERLVAIALAAQVGAALRAYETRRLK